MNADKKRGRRDKDKMDNTAFLARNCLGGTGVTMQQFSDLTGTSMSAIARREYGQVNFPGTARALYSVIIELEKAGLSQEALAALESVPKEDRSEGRALAQLIICAANQNKVNTVRRALGDEDAKDEAEETLNGADFQRIIEGIGQALESKAEKVGGKSAERYRAAAAKTGEMLYLIRRGQKEEEEESKPGSP